MIDIYSRTPALERIDRYLFNARLLEVYNNTRIIIFNMFIATNFKIYSVSIFKNANKMFPKHSTRLNNKI